MKEIEIPGIGFRDKLFHLFRIENAKDNSFLKYYLTGPFKRTRRTNLFLGGRGKRQVWEGYDRKFTRFDEKGNLNKCFLIQLHKELYLNSHDTKNTESFLTDEYSLVKDESLVWFETMGFDCIYLADKRVRKSKSKYPIAWSYDWIIEVENEFEEFSFTLRGLLDINCNKRMAIFFSDDFLNDDNGFLSQINIDFKPVWELYVSPRYTESILSHDPYLHALVFPDTFTDLDHYLINAKLVKWDQAGGKFILARPYDLSSY